MGQQQQQLESATGTAGVGGQIAGTSATTAGDMQLLCEWPDAGLGIGARVQVHTTDPSGEWAFAKSSCVPNGVWLPRTLLQHTLYPARGSYAPTAVPASSDKQNSNKQTGTPLLTIRPKDNLLVYYRDPSGWTYGEVLPANQNLDEPRIGWYPTSMVESGQQTI